MATYDPYEEKIIGLREQKQFAQKLREQAGQTPQGQMVSGWYVAPSWTQHAANLLRGYTAGRQEREAEQGIKDVMGERTAQREQLLGQMPRSQTSENRTEFDAMGPQMSQTVQPKTEDYLAWAGKMSSVDPAMAQMGMQYANLSEGREQRKSELATRIAENRASAQEKREFQEAEAQRNREWRSQESEAGRRQQESMARLASALRPERQMQIVDTDQGKMRVLPNGQLAPLTDIQGNAISGPKGPQGTLARQNEASQALSAIAQARKVLPGATSSGIGSAADAAAAFFGQSTEGAQKAAQLKAIEGDLVSKMPKMSGPQSDKDVILYRQMAGLVGDASTPRETREAALNAVEEIQRRYAGLPPKEPPMNLGRQPNPASIMNQQNQPPAFPSLDAINAELARRKGSR